MGKPKSSSRKSTATYESGVHKLFKRHLESKMSVSADAVAELDNQALFLVDKIVRAAVGARKGVFKTATMNAACVKAGLGLVLPEDVHVRALEAGEMALVKLVRQEEKEASREETAPAPSAA